MTSLRVVPIVFTCVALWLTSVSTAQTLEDALAGLNFRSSSPLDSRVVDCASVKFFLLSPDYWNHPRLPKEYAKATPEGRARLAYLARRLDPRRVSVDFFRRRALDVKLPSEERYLCGKVVGSFSGYWRGQRAPYRPGDHGLSPETRERLDQLLEADVGYADDRGDRQARSMEVMQWIRDLERKDERGGYERTPNIMYARGIMRRERRAEPELLDAIEDDLLDGKVGWDVGLIALDAGSDEKRALAFARKYWLRAASSNEVFGLRLMLRRLGQNSDAEMLLGASEPRTNPRTRQMIIKTAGEIVRRLRREARARRRDEMIKRTRSR